MPDSDNISHVIKLLLLNYKTEKNVGELLDRYFDFGIVYLSGLAMSLSVEPFAFFPLAWISLASLWFLILKNSCKKKVLLLSLCWGYAYHGATLSWILDFHPLTWMGIPWIASFVFAVTYWIVISSLGALFVSVWAYGLKLVAENYSIKVQIFTATALWICLEWFFRQSPFWWTSLSLTQSPSNLWFLQLNQISGAETSVAIIVTVNGLLANGLWLSNKKRSSNNKYNLYHIALYITLIAHVIGALIYYYPAHEVNENKISIGIIQGGISHKIKFEDEGLALAEKRYLEGYKLLSRKKVDAVLTPELALPYFGTEVLTSETDIDILKAVKEAKIPFWIGTRTTNYKDMSIIKQSLISLDKTGIVSKYDKVKLILFGEYIPFTNTILEPIVRKIFPFGINHSPGNKNQTFETQFGKAIVGICYESAFPQIFLRQAQAGGKFIVVATADGLFGESMMQQHHAQDVLRVVETSRWLIRANSQNYSGLIDSKGNTKWLSTEGYQTKKIDLYLSNHLTLYTRLGNWLTPILLFLSVWVLFTGRNKSLFPKNKF
jgi:apolipoprotein N-acyltransferase